MTSFKNLGDILVNNDISELKEFIEENNIDVNKAHIPVIFEPIIFIAMKYGTKQIVEYLIENYNADLDIKNDIRESLLHFAARCGKVEIAKYLIEKKNLDPNVKNDLDETPLHKIVEKLNRLTSNNYQMIKYLTENNHSEPNAQNRHGHTPLHFTVMNDSKDSAEYLLNSRDGEGLPVVDVNAETNRGETPLMLAQNPRMQQLLRHRGAKEKREAEDIRQLVNDSQSTHNTRVTESVSASVERLKERFASNSFEEFEDFKAYLQDKDKVKSELAAAGFNEPESVYNTAINRFDEVTQSSWFTHMASGYTDFKTVLGLVWAALKDTWNPHPEIGIDLEDQNLEAERHASLIKVFTTMRGICPEGRFNKIVEAADRMHADIEINRLARVAEGEPLSREFLRANQDNLLQKTFDKLSETPKKLIFNNYNITDISPEKFDRMAQLVIGAAKQSLKELVPDREFAPNELIVLEEFMEEEAQFITHVSREDRESYIDTQNDEALEIYNLHEKELESQKNNKIINAISEAAKEGDLDKIQENVKKMPDINATDSSNKTPLAALFDNAFENNELLSEFIRENSDDLDTDKPITGGIRPLSLAASHRNIELIDVLLEARANASMRDSNPAGKTPLHHAAKSGDPEITSKLINAGGDIEAVTSKIAMYKGHTPLMIAASKGQIEVAKLLIARGADIEKKDKEGKTAIDLAEEAGWSELVEKISSLEEEFREAELLTPEAGDGEVSFAGPESASSTLEALGQENQADHDGNA